MQEERVMLCPYQKVDSFKEGNSSGDQIPYWGEEQKRGMNIYSMVLQMRQRYIYR